MSDQQLSEIPKKRSPVWAFAIGAGIFLIGFIIGGGGTQRAHCDVNSVNHADASTPQTEAQSAPASLRTTTTLLDVKGSGSKTTQSFTATGEWTLTYSYDCSDFGTRGNFVVSVRNADGSVSGNQGVNELGRSGSDTEYYHSPGTMFLQINSTCSWYITVIG
jgi:hypothetical protein